METKLNNFKVSMYYKDNPRQAINRECNTIEQAKALAQITGILKVLIHPQTEDGEALLKGYDSWLIKGTVIVGMQSPKK